MKAIKIRCRKCEAILTNTLQPTTIDFHHFEEGEEIVGRGFYCVGHQDISIAHDDRILVNNRDSKLISHKQLNNYRGCCGYYDTDFLNQMCPNCQQGIATIVTECYTYHYIGIRKDKINIEEVLK